MSKSLNNGILLEDLLNEFNPEIIRMSLLENNYRSDMNVIDGAIEEHEEKIYSIYKLFDDVDKLCKDVEFNNNCLEYKQIDQEFRQAMDNDFNTSLAITYIFKYVSDIRKMMNPLKKENYEKIVNIKGSLIKVYKVLGLLQQEPTRVIEDIRNKYLKKYNISLEEILNLIDKRNEFKKVKNYEEADKVRNYLLEHGITIKDSSLGCEWDIVIKR